MRVLLTGASGFVGSAIRHVLSVQAIRVRPVYRSAASATKSGASETWDLVIESTLSAATDWTSALSDVDVVIHAAARVHVMSEVATDPLTEFRKVNVEGTANLARQAAAAGVRRFIFISSVKVNGEGTESARAYFADDVPAPADPYGISKAEAESALQQVGRETEMDVVIIRPVLVYGPGVKANFLSMMRWVNRGLPLPLGAVTANRRSLVALDNLVDLIWTCVDHPGAANEIFLVSDGEDLSTAMLLRRLAAAFGRSARLIRVPVWMLNLGARLLGRGAVAQRLCGSLQVDISKTRKLLGWTPPVSVDAALSKTVRHFLLTRDELGQRNGDK